MEHLTDEQLAKLAGKGNRQALETLIARNLKLVYSFVYRYAKNNHDTEDITQEVFVKVWKHIGTYDHEKNFRPWLATIAKNTALDFLKKKSVLPFSALTAESEGDTEWLAQSLPDTGPSPELQTDRVFLGERMSQALRKLTPKYAEVVSLYHSSELNFREIAERNRESLNTVKSRYRRAIQQLRQLW